MKKTNIFYGNQYVGSFNCDGKRYTKVQLYMFIAKRTIKNSLAIAAIIMLAGWIFTAGAILSKNTVKPERVWAKEIVEVPVKEVPPVMKRIAKCESGDTHFKNGQVIFNANSNGSVDRGRYQINSVWDKKATEMKLDLSNERDNETFAMWLYENYGTEHWYSSKSCWK